MNVCFISMPRDCTYYVGDDESKDTVEEEEQEDYYDDDDDEFEEEDPRVSQLEKRVDRRGMQNTYQLKP